MSCSIQTDRQRDAFADLLHRLKQGVAHLTSWLLFQLFYPTQTGDGKEKRDSERKRNPKIHVCGSANEKIRMGANSLAACRWYVW
jgi:hypothetical protein